MTAPRSPQSPDPAASSDAGGAPAPEQRAAGATGSAKPQSPPVASTPPAAPVAPAARTRRSRGPWLVSLAALVVASLAALLSLYAVVEARDARSGAAASAPDGGAGPGAATDAPEPPPPAAAEPTPPDAVPTATGSEYELTPQADYRQKYRDSPLHPRATEDAVSYIDLDEPRLGADANEADLTLAADFGDPVPYLIFQEGVQVAESTDADLTAADCANRIRTSALPEPAAVAAQRDVRLCVATSPDRAISEGIPRRIVALRVTASTDESAEFRVSLSLTAWDVPR